LDPRARVELRELIKSMADLGKTIFISSHILSELGEMCDAMLVIERGKLIVEGSLEEIKAGVKKRKGEGAHHLALLVRLLPEASVEGLRARLLELPRVNNAKAGPKNTLSVDFAGAEEDAAALLKQLVREEFPIVEFAPKDETMEELFMQLTTGEVQ
jgi:ABC-2 type transport system ATP-binding protein